MSYKTLAKDIADDIRIDIQDGIVTDIDRAINEAADGSEVSFKPAAATKYLKATGALGTNCNHANEILAHRIRKELIKLGVDI